MTEPSLRYLYDRLADLRTSAVPVVGAGLAAGSGAPTSEELADALATAAGSARLPDENLYSLADRLEALHGAAWVQHAVAEAIRSAPIEPSLALQALTLAPGRVVATTNYDHSIELAAERHGLRPVTLTPKDLPAVLRGPDEGDLFVLHLHGTAVDPDTIVLTSSSYEAAHGDEQLRMAVSTLAAGRTLVFLGHSLAATEAHLRRDIRGMVELFGPGDHLLLHPDDERIEDPEGFHSDTGVEPLAVPNADRTWRFVITAAQALGTPPLLRSGGPMEVCSVPVEPAYQPMYAGPSSEVATESNRAVWLYGRFVDHAVTTVSDLTHRRLLLVGAPGTGKTQELLYLSSQSPEPSIYLHLGAATPPWGLHTARDTFLRWMERACARRPGVPRVTAETLRDDIYAFMLDGLDEVRPLDRAEVMRVIAEVASEHPQHRWILASRRVPQLEGALDGFADYELVPSREWLLAYASQRGVGPEQIDAIIADVPGMDDIIQVPLFAAAAVDVVIRGEHLPASPLDLLLNFASRGLREEGGRLMADRDDVERWLDRLSFAMLVAEIDDVDSAEASVDELRGAALGADVTIDWLVTRATLQDAGGRVRPMTRTLQDARAARLLAQHPGGPALLLRHGCHRVGYEVRFRPRWHYVVDLLLAHDPARWAPVISDVDEVAVARATPQDAPAPERDGAMWTIWAWYREHRIHIPRRREGQLLDDADAMVRLAQQGLAPELEAELVASLQSPDAPTRGNATVLLSSSAGDVLEPHLTELLNDDDAVVRRRAAEAVAHLKLYAYADVLLTRGLEDPDELARRTLTSVALEIASDDQLPGFVGRLPHNLQREVQLTLDRRWTRRQQLDFLASQADPDRHWVDHLIQVLDGAWSHEEIATLAMIWRGDPYASNDRRIQSILRQEPLVAVKACLDGEVHRRDLFDLIPLFDLVEPEELLRIAPDVGDEANEIVQEYLDWKRHRATSRTEGPVSGAPAQPPSLSDIVASGDVDVLLQLDYAANVKDLSTVQRTALVELVQHEWTAQRSAGGPLGFIEVTGERQWSAPRRTWHLLHLADELQLPLTDSEWFQLANLGLANMDDWLSMTFLDPWAQRLQEHVATATDAGIEAIVRNVTQRLDASVAQSLAARALASEDNELRRALASRLAHEGHREVLLEAVSAHPSHEVDVALVVLGDEEAEQRCLDEYIERDCPRLDHWGGDREWLESIRHEKSADQLLRALRLMLRRGDAPHELRPLFQALERCLGGRALDLYDELVADSEIPGAAFLWYQREEAISRVASALHPLPDFVAAVADIEWSN